MAGSAILRAALAGALVVVYRLLSATWRYRFVDRELFDGTLEAGPAVFAFWHGEQLAVFGPHGHKDIDGMASRSQDGDLLARCISRLGYGVIRGSTSRGGASAIRAAVRGVARGRSPALAVDGPRGPWHVPQVGALRIAAETGSPLLFVVAHAHRAVRVRSWDRLVIPLPFSRVTVGYGRMSVTSAARDDLENARLLLRSEMEALGAAVLATVG
jgi:lysophospholipid acyltransferase (LPLAT)-like uncharacterized protein